MAYRYTTRTLLALVVWAGGVGSLSGQPLPEGPAAEGRTPPTGAAPVQELKPEVYYLKDEKGNLVLVPTFSFAEWDRLQKLDLARGAPPPPSHVFVGGAELNVEAGNGHAQLSARFKIRLTENRSSSASPAEDTAAKHWAAVPLRMGSAALREVPTYIDGRPLIVQFDAASGGYLCWLHGAPGSEHEILLRLVVATPTVGTERRLSLLTPPVPTRLLLKVPVAQATAQVLNQTSNISDTDHQADHTLFTVDGSGDFQLAWQETSLPRAAPVVEAAGTIAVRIEGEQRVRSDVRLKVRSFGQPLELLTVRLPPGMRLVQEMLPGSNAEYQISAADSGGGTPENSRAASLRVRFQRETVGPVEVRFTTEWVGPFADRTFSEMEVAGYEVLGASRQFGHVELSVDGDLAVRWREGTRLNRVEAETSMVRPLPLLARFEYFAQPCQLFLSVSPKRTQVAMEPVHVLDIQPDRVLLTSSYKVSISGGTIDRLRFDCADWTVDRILPASLPASEVPLEGANPLVVPLAFSATGSFEIVVQAHRNLPENSRLSLLLPRPLDAVLSPATLAVVSADNVEVIPRHEELKGLVPESLAPTLTLPTRQQAPLYFREQGPLAGQGKLPLEPDLFVADVNVREQSLALAVAWDVQVSGPLVDVTQRLTYQVAYVPLSSIQLRGPRTLWESGTVQVSLGEQVLPVEILEEGDANEADGSQATVRVDLLEGRLGTCELRVKYAVPLPFPAAQPDTQVQVPLLLPVAPVSSAGEVALRLLRGEQVQVTMLGEEWASAEPPADPPVQAFELTSGSLPATLQLSLRQVDSPRGSSTIVLRGWWQTWLTATERRDRVSLLVTTREPVLRIRLPVGLASRDVEVALNKRRWSATPTGDDELTIRLPRSEASSPWVLELWCWSSQRHERWGTIPVRLPMLIGVDRVERCFWELALPPDEHLLMGPSQWIPEYSWEWSSGLFRRRPYQQQAALEQWIGASRQEPLPAGTNRYLFSTMGPLEGARVLLASRVILAFLVIGPMLLVGTAVLLYTDWLRAPVLIALGVVLGAVGFVFPEPAVLIAQVATGGIALLVVARLLQVHTPSPRVRREPSSRASSPIESASLEFRPPGKAGATITTATAPANVSVVAAESTYEP